MIKLNELTQGQVLQDKELCDSDNMTKEQLLNDQLDIVEELFEKYFKSLITREIKICLLKENYRVGVYTFTNCQNKYVLNIIKNIIQDIGFIKINPTYISIVFDNGSFIKILSCDKSIRGDRFNNVIVNNLINRQDVDEVILPTLRFCEDDTNNIRDKVFYCEF